MIIRIILILVVIVIVVIVVVVVIPTVTCMYNSSGYSTVPGGRGEGERVIER